MSNFGTQHAKQEIERSPEDDRAFSPAFVTLSIFLILTVLGLCLYSPVLEAFASSQRLAQATELLQLQQAVNSYITKYGEAPPEAVPEKIKLHVQNSKHTLSAVNLNLDDFSHDVSTLDDRETLVFWLGGDAWRSISSANASYVFFEFPAERLSDVDNDGWPEYRDKKGNFFIFKNYKVLLYNSSMQTESSSDDLINNRHSNRLTIKTDG